MPCRIGRGTGLSEAGLNVANRSVVVCRFSFFSESERLLEGLNRLCDFVLDGLFARGCSFVVPAAIGDNSIRPERNWTFFPDKDLEQLAAGGMRARVRPWLS